MRSFVRNGLILGTVAAAFVLGSGCKGKQATEYVTGISTQVTVPRDLKSVRVEVAVGGVVAFCQGYAVYNGRVQLPRSLGTYPFNNSGVGSPPVTYTITGMTDTYSDISENPLFADCLSHPAKVGQDTARILRRSRQPYIPDDIRFLPMPLKFSCYDKVCDNEEQTCKGGKCVSIDTNEKNLPPYDPSLLEGTGGDCFSMQLCMGASVPAALADPTTCDFAVPETPSAPVQVGDVNPFRPTCTSLADCNGGQNPENTATARQCNAGKCDALPPNTPWEGVNVEVAYDGGLTKEILDLDPEEGFFVPDPQKPQRFRLAPGLCEMLKGVDSEGKPTAHRITAVRTSGTCVGKTITQPLCAADQLKAMGANPDGTAAAALGLDEGCKATELKPPRAALVVVVDRTLGHDKFFDPKQIGSIGLPLQDPALAQTDLGLVYAPGNDPAQACSTTRAPELALAPSGAAGPSLLASLLKISTDKVGSPLLPGAPSYEGALSSSYALLNALPDTYFRRAVLLLGNREFNADTCAAAVPGTPVDLANAARTSATKPINTYVLQLVSNDGGVTLADPLTPENSPELYALTGAGLTLPPGTPLPYNPDGRGDARRQNAKDSFQQVINSLATCVYDVDDNTSKPDEGGTLTYSDPLLNKTVPIAFNAACNADNVAGTGWGYGGTAPAGKKRIHVCSTDCTAYQKVLSDASNFTLLYQQPALAVPLFAHKKACEPKTP